MRGDRAVVNEELRRALARHADRAVLAHSSDPGQTELTLVVRAGDLVAVLAGLGAGGRPSTPAALRVPPSPSGPSDASVPPRVPPREKVDHGLTGRELRVLELIATGISNQDVADLMSVTHNTVKSYIRSAYRKIGVTSRSQAVRWVYERPSTYRASWQ